MPLPKSAPVPGFRVGAMVRRKGTGEPVGEVIATFGSWFRVRWPSGVTAQGTPDTFSIVEVERNG